MSCKVLVAGYGSAGQYVVDFLLKDHRISEIEEIHIMSRKSEEEVSPRLTISKIASGLSERYIPLIYHQCDFNDVSHMAEIIESVSPKVIIYTGRYVSGIKYGSLSYPHEIGYGVWMPLSFPYIYKLMRAVKMTTCHDVKVINTSFPDGVNYLLGQNNLAPYCGAGNINHLIPRIKYAVNKLTGCNFNKIEVNLVCAHYVNTYVSKEGTNKGGDFSLQVTCDDQSVLLTEDILKYCKDNSAGGQIRNQMIATDCAEITRLLVSENDKFEGESIHVPGLNGRPGGRRCVLRDHDLIGDTSWGLEESHIDSINIQGLYKDGVTIIDGKLGFTDEARDKMKEVYNIDYPSSALQVNEIQDFADELVYKLKEVINK